MIDYRSLPPRVYNPDRSVETVIGPISSDSEQFYTDIDNPPSIGVHYWDPDAGCWLPRMSAPAEFWRHVSMEKGSTAKLPSNSITIMPNSPPANPYRKFSTPADVAAYIRANYASGEIRENYSDIRNSLVYAKDTPITLTPRTRSGRLGATPATVTVTPGSTYSFTVGGGSYLESEVEVSTDLTGREGSDILEETPQPEEDEVDTVLSRSEAEAAFKRASAALAKLEELEGKYSPDLPDGSVVAFRLTFPNTPTSFNYSAIRAAGQWFPTGKISSNYNVGTGVDWSALLECFERFQATDFEVLRTGGEEKELPPGTVTNRVVTLKLGAETDAFRGGTGVADNSDPDDDDDDEDASYSD